MRNVALSVAAGLCLVVALGAGAQPGAAKNGLPKDPSLHGQLKPHNSPYYVIYTDLPEEDSQEALLRMTKMAEEYHERTKGLFKGQISGKLPFYLYAERDDYYKAGGMAGSAGVFDGHELMAMSIRDKSGRVGTATWHVVQHEGFHQFVDAVIKGQVPTWANEGLAEYFGESVFTGDGMVTGLIPAGRLARLKHEMEQPGFKHLKDIMLMSHTEWNSAIGAKPDPQQGGGSGAGANYDTAWAMVHFMAHAEGGKYQGAFSNFLVQMGTGKTWEKAWVNSFGSDEGFEKKWREYWLNMPDNPTADLYAQAVVSTFTSFLGRAATQKQTFETFDSLIANSGKDLKANAADWLPPNLFDDMKGLVEPLQKQGAVFTLIVGKGPSPSSIQCVMGDGVKITGTYTTAGSRIGKVKVEQTKTPPAAAVKPAKPPTAAPATKP